jgi:hypothetical protein
MFNRVRRPIYAELLFPWIDPCAVSVCEARQHRSVVKDDADVIGERHRA